MDENIVSINYNNAEKIEEFGQKLDEAWKNLLQLILKHFEVKSSYEKIRDDRLEKIKTNNTSNTIKQLPYDTYPSNNSYSSHYRNPYASPYSSTYTPPPRYNQIPPSEEELKLLQDMSKLDKTITDSFDCLHGPLFFDRDSAHRAVYNMLYDAYGDEEDLPDDLTAEDKNIVEFIQQTLSEHFMGKKKLMKTNYAEKIAELFTFRELIRLPGDNNHCFIHQKLCIIFEQAGSVSLIQKIHTFMQRLEFFGGPATQKETTAALIYMLYFWFNENSKTLANDNVSIDVEIADAYITLFNKLSVSGYDLTELSPEKLIKYKGFSNVSNHLGSYENLPFTLLLLTNGCISTDFVSSTDPRLRGVITLYKRIRKGN